MPKRYYWPILALVALCPVSGCFVPMNGDTVEITAEDGPDDERALSVVLTYDLDRIWSQDDGRARGLVVYSLGYTACTPSVSEFATLLASLGYVFAVPDHDDIYKICRAVSDSPSQENGKVSVGGEVVDAEALAAYSSLEEEKLFSFEQLENYFHYRNIDLSETIEHLTSNDTYEFGSLADKPVFLVGYSLGGWNALMVAGASRLYPDLTQDVTAVICEAPYFGDLREECMKQVSCPVLYLVGTEDDFLPNVYQLSSWCPGSSCLVEIEGANHYLFAADLCRSPVLSTLFLGSCTEESAVAGDKVNALMAEFILKMTVTPELPALEGLETYDPELFNVVYRTAPE